MTSPTRKSRFTLSFRNFVELCNRLKGIGEDISIHAKAYSKCRYTRKAMALWAQRPKTILDELAGEATGG